MEVCKPSQPDELQPKLNHGLEKNDGDQNKSKSKSDELIVDLINAFIQSKVVNQKRFQWFDKMFF